tara:strand:- start:1899 stop:2594 length:696 start_codon:yes stop_codon:yes gene_type:complete
MKILCSICARAGSKGLLKKNIKKFVNKPLIFYTINQAKKTNIFDKIVCSSDSLKILQISKKYGVDFTIKRPRNLCQENVPKLYAIKHLTKVTEKHFKTKFDLIVDLDITAPLRSQKDIINSVNKIKNITNKPSNLLTLTPSRRNPYYNMIEIKNNCLVNVKKNKKKVTSRQKSPKVFDINAGVYVWNRLGLLKNKGLINKNTRYYITPNDRSLDIDSDLDFKIVQFLYKNK